MSLSCAAFPSPQPFNPLHGPLNTTSHAESRWQGAAEALGYNTHSASGRSEPLSTPLAPPSALSQAFQLGCRNNSPVFVWQIYALHHCANTKPQTNLECLPTDYTSCKVWESNHSVTMDTFEDFLSSYLFRKNCQGYLFIAHVCVEDRVLACLLFV